MEVAGTALAVLPLLLTAVQHYDDICQPFIRYKHFSSGVERFQSSLRTQRRIFLNTSQLLLQHIVDYEASSELLDRKTAIDTALEDALARVLGHSGEECYNIIQHIQETLRSIEKEKFMDIEKDDAFKSIQHPSDENESLSWQRKLVKAKFSISKRRLDSYLASLRISNDEYRTLTSQMLDLAKPKLEANGSRQVLLSKDIRKFKIIQDASRQLYEVLGRACTVHMEHTAHFCLEVENTILNRNSPLKIDFSLALAYSTPTSSVSRGGPVWFMVESIAENDLTSSVAPRSYLQTLKHAIEQQENNFPEKILKSAEKSGRGWSSTTATEDIHSNASMSVSHTNLPDLCKLGNLCTVLRPSFNTSTAQQKACAKECVGLLQETQAYRQLVYPLSKDSNFRTKAPMSLEDLITILSKNRATMSLGRYEKVCLARKLATAVLQYNSTPWLKDAWRSNDIYFFDAQVNDNSEETLNLTSPHFKRKLSLQEYSLSNCCEITANPYADNQILFGLGIILLELCYEEPLTAPQTRPDLQQTDPMHYQASCEFIKAKRLAASAMVSRRMGSAYYRIVQKCLSCDFGNGSDLSLTNLQQQFFKDVVCELENLEVKLKSLELDDKRV